MDIFYSFAQKVRFTCFPKRLTTTTITTTTATPTTTTTTTTTNTTTTTTTSIRKLSALCYKLSDICNIYHSFLAVSSSMQQALFTCKSYQSYQTVNSYWITIKSTVEIKSSYVWTSFKYKLGFTMINFYPLILIMWQEKSVYEFF